MRLLEPFRFIKHFRERREARAELARLERNAERTHQALLLRTFLTSLETIQETSASEAKANSQALIKVAESVSEQAKGFGEWMKLFQAGSAPTTSVVRDEDEYAAEQQRNIDAGLPVDVAGLPPEFQLAWALKNDPNQLLA